MVHKVLFQAVLGGGYPLLSYIQDPLCLHAVLCCRVGKQL